VQSAPAFADTQKQSPEWFSQFHREVRRLVKKYYPKASSHVLVSAIHFEQDTRIFVVHEPLKTGEWQDPRKQRGPKKSGILGRIELRQGKYLGAAVAPHSFDKRYFSVLFLAPYSSKCDCHLYTHLSYPQDVDKRFLSEFRSLVDEFERHYLTPTSGTLGAPRR